VSRERICGPLRRVTGDNERGPADKATQRLAKRCRHYRCGVTERAASVIKELYVKVVPAAFESHEQETVAAVRNLCGEIGGHSFEAGHTNRSRAGSKCNSAHRRKSNADAGEAARPDCCRYDVERRRGQR
jgi:hypothetical protein